jgi:hypothetical protein
LSHSTSSHTACPVNAERTSTNRNPCAAARPAIVVGAAVAGILTLVALPWVLGVGADPDNPSFLPRDYGRNLLLVDVGVLVVAALWATVATRRARSADDGS